jgi:hypothetical protein
MVSFDLGSAENAASAMKTTTETEPRVPRRASSFFLFALPLVGAHH